MRKSVESFYSLKEAAYTTKTPYASVTANPYASLKEARYAEVALRKRAGSEILNKKRPISSSTISSYGMPDSKSKKLTIRVVKKTPKNIAF